MRLYPKLIQEKLPIACPCFTKNWGTMAAIFWQACCPNFVLHEIVNFIDCSNIYPFGLWDHLDPLIMTGYFWVSFGGSKMACPRWLLFFGDHDHLESCHHVLDVLYTLCISFSCSVGVRADPAPVMKEQKNSLNRELLSSPALQIQFDDFFS